MHNTLLVVFVILSLIVFGGGLYWVRPNSVAPTYAPVMWAIVFIAWCYVLMRLLGLLA